MLTIQAERHLSAEDTKALAGSLLDEGSFDRLVTENCDAICNDGEPLFHFRKSVIPQNVLISAYGNIMDAATISDQRGTAGGYVDVDKTATQLWDTGEKTASKNTARLGYQAANGYRRANMVQSGIMGYMDKMAKMPYCRTTAYSLQQPERFKQAIPFIQSVSDTFRAVAPERFAAQQAIIRQTHPDFTIHDTVFTTVTVNRNWQTAVHTDKGDYAEGMGVMSAMWRGKGDGCYFVFPAYRLAVSMRTGDVLLANVHEWHGNTPFKGTPGRYERIACVFYYRSNMHKCGSAEEELERAKKRKMGERLYED